MPHTLRKLGPDRVHRAAAAVALGDPSNGTARRYAAMASAATIQAPLLVVGSINADLVLQLDRLPCPGETIGASNLQIFPGGKGANQAAAAAKLGYPTYFLGQVGTDSYVPMLCAALSSAGVQLDHLKEVEGPSGTAVVLLQAQGENSIIIVGGANQDLNAWQLSQQALEAIHGAGAVLLQREIPEFVNLQVAKAAAAAGVPVVLDAGGMDAPIADELLQHLTVISPNETELQRLTGLPVSSEQQLLAAAASLQHHVGRQQQQQQEYRQLDQLQQQEQQLPQTQMAQQLQVLLKLGTAGSMLLGATGRDQVVKQPAIKPPKVVDTTGKNSSRQGYVSIKCTAEHDYCQVNDDYLCKAATTTTRAV
eukprot:GHRR01014063.1.p1 GENE.GHRR01014063.1~~GHRR01014063.1.p1  ORF type:complete len:365 (+),score=170.54 GHRR01014063.1:1194-2288(+)